MNKISKKIVSLVTMAAFALTLVPMAAFAAPTSTQIASSVDVTTDKIASDDSATVDVKIDSADVGNGIVLWVQDANGIYDDATYSVDGTNVQKVSAGANDPWYGDQYAVFSASAATTAKVTISGLVAGSYTVYAAANVGNQQNATWNDLTPLTYTDQDITVIPAADVDYSGYGVVTNGAVDETAAVNVGDTLNTRFVVNYDENTATDDQLGPVAIWAVAKGDKVGEVDTTVEFNGEKGSLGLLNVSNADPEKVEVTFNKAGTYTLYAGIGSTVAVAKDHLLGDFTTVTVTAEPVVIDKIDTVKANVENAVDGKTDKEYPITFKNGIGELDLTNTTFAFDGVDTITITGIAKDENGKALQGKTITATTNKDTVVEFDKDENNVVNAVTDNYGKFTISFKMPNKENATVTLVNEEANLSYTIQIWAVKSTAKDITRTLTDGYVLAGNDSKYGDEVYGNNAEVSFADAVAFKITDQQGEAMTGQAAADGAKIDVRAVAKNSTLKNGDLKLIWDQDAGVYTLAYTGKDAAGTYVKDLVPGKYEVRVALPSEDGATVTFNVAKFGKVQDTVLAVTARDYDQSPANPNEEVMTVDDTITLGQQITVNAKYVDENGLKVPAKYVSFNFNGKAVSDWNKWNNVFATEPDIAANDSLIGTTVKVVAFNTANKQLVEKTLTVADSYTDKSLEFSSDNGAVSKDNKVNVSVVNEDGKVQQVEGYMTAWVADQSNEDAKISVDVNKNGAHDVQNGKGSLTVYADQETTADIVVVVKAGTEAYYGTLEYTFGSENAIANRTVVMTIDSTEYVVNNKIITGDAAPYIDSNWRTMVPIRALAESFDAEVIWNQDDSTVTINFDGDTQIVMTVGETAYTVDGAEATMDTEPVNAGDRVYVPVRFAAEGLGFSVLPLYNEAGLTASVVFQK